MNYTDYCNLKCEMKMRRMKPEFSAGGDIPVNNIPDMSDEEISNLIREYEKERSEAEKNETISMLDDFFNKFAKNRENILIIEEMCGTASSSMNPILEPQLFTVFKINSNNKWAKSISLADIAKNDELYAGFYGLTNHIFDNYDIPHMTELFIMDYISNNWRGYLGIIKAEDGYALCYFSVNFVDNRYEMKESYSDESAILMWFN